MNRAILVKSCQRFRRRQEACRNSWAGELVHGLGRRGCLPRGVRLLFIEGGHKFTATTVLGNVWPTGDVIQMDCGDDYKWNSIKLRNALQLELMMQSDPPDYYFICDDDTFVHPQRWLAHEPQGDLEGRVFQPRTEKHRKKNNGRPWIAGGAGWWMSRRMCQLYVDQVTERCSWDDLLVARVAQENGIEIVGRPDLYGADRYSGCDPPERVSADNALITCHHVQPEEMVRLWEACRGD